MHCAAAWLHSEGGHSVWLGQPRPSRGCAPLPPVPHRPHLREAFPQRCSGQMLAPRLTAPVLAKVTPSARSSKLSRTHKNWQPWSSVALCAKWGVTTRSHEASSDSRTFAPWPPRSRARLRLPGISEKLCRTVRRQSIAAWPRLTRARAAAATCPELPTRWPPRICT